MESALAGVTAGNGAIYAVRADAYEDLPPSGSHDLSFPFRLAKRGLRSLYAPGARAEEKMVPTIEGEFARKRRMMVGLWDIVVGEGMLVPRGYPPLFAFELLSHRLLRYATPFLHVLVLLANLVLLGTGWFYYLTLLLQLALLGVAALSNHLPDDTVVRVAVATTSSPRPRSSSASGTAFATGPEGVGRRPRGRDEGPSLMPHAVDRLLAALGLVVLSPVLLAFAIWIKLDSRGPVIYRRLPRR